MRTFLSVVVALAGLSALAVGGEVKLADVFADGAVLQRDAPVPVWGMAEPGQTVTVEFGGQTASALTDDCGSWTATLAPMTASSEPRALRVRGGGMASIQNVLVGEVWLCAGQSNMAMIVDKARDADREKTAANLPGLRVFTVDRAASISGPLSSCSGGWAVSTPETAGRFSATAFFFGRELHRELDVPVGLIVAAWSGSAIEAWTSLSAQQLPALRELLDSWEQKDAEYTPDIAVAEQAEYEKQLTAWREAYKQAAQSGQLRPKSPRRPVNPREHWHHPAVLFNGMIAPLIPYRIRGAIWYQGETNAGTEAASALYELQLPLLIRDWRTRWNQGDFPMAWVQLPLHSARLSHWPRIRESMLKATSEPNTGMVVTFDIGEEHRLHPVNKQAFGHRLAIWARAQVYGEEIPWSGPLPAGHRRDGSKFVLHFDHTHGGLASKGDELRGFIILDQDGTWRPAQASIVGNTVVVSHPEVTRPVAVRYAWANDPDGNLVNGAGLPASPFRTDSISPSQEDPDEVEQPAEAGSVVSPPPTCPPLDPADIGVLPDGTERLDLFLLTGQSNMKGRGIMPEAQKKGPEKRGGPGAKNTG